MYNLKLLKYNYLNLNLVSACKKNMGCVGKIGPFMINRCCHLPKYPVRYAGTAEIPYNLIMALISGRYSDLSTQRDCFPVVM